MALAKIISLIDLLVTRERTEARADVQAALVVVQEAFDDVDARLDRLEQRVNEMRQRGTL